MSLHLLFDGRRWQLIRNVGNNHISERASVSASTAYTTVNRIDLHQVFIHKHWKAINAHFALVTCSQSLVGAARKINNTEPTWQFQEEVGEAEIVEILAWAATKACTPARTAAVNCRQQNILKRQEILCWFVPASKLSGALQLLQFAWNYYSISEWKENRHAKGSFVAQAWIFNNILYNKVVDIYK